MTDVILNKRAISAAAASTCPAGNHSKITDVNFAAVASYASGSQPEDVVVADLNGDCRLDLVVSNNFSDNLSVFLGKGDGTFHPAVQYSYISC